VSVRFSVRYFFHNWKGLTILAALLFTATTGVVFAMQNGGLSGGPDAQATGAVAGHQHDTAFMSGRTQGGVSPYIPIFPSIEAMTDMAHAVVVVTFTDDFLADHEVRRGDADDILVEYLARVRSARVVESLHGPHAKGDILAIARGIHGSSTLGVEGFEGFEHSWDHGDWPNLDPGTKYLLFLFERPASAEWGLPPSVESEWSLIAGTPAYGIVEEDLVTFVHRSNVSEEALQVADTLDAPLSEIREAVARGAAGEGVGLFPAEQEEADRLLRRGQALEQLVEEAQAMESVDAVRDRAFELGLDAASLDDPAFCRKAEAIVAGETGHALDLACDGP
jgi:hypothetical protein